MGYEPVLKPDNPSSAFNPRCGVPDWGGAATPWGVAKDEVPSELKIAAGLRLRATRLALGDLSQDEMANVLGTTRSALARWELGENLAGVPAMIRLFLRFGVPLEWIYAGLLRTTPYDLGQELEAAAAQVGAPVGGPVEETAYAASRSGADVRGRPAATVPRARRRSGALHESRKPVDDD